MDTSNKQNLFFSVTFFAASVISYLRGETIALISSTAMSLTLLLVYFIFRKISRNYI
jgi:hypothetical protein